jgi:hypothetical protein
MEIYHEERVGWKMCVYVLVCMSAYIFIYSCCFLLFVCQMDCCHSGTAMDLPYEINATESKMHANKGFGGMAGLLQEPAAIACCACLAFILIDGLLDG